jgi:transposase
MENKTIFLEIFGDSPILRVLDFLVVNEEFDYSMTDIASLSGVGYSTLKLFWEKLEKEGIVVKTRTVGKAKMYKLNTANPVIKKFRDFYWETTKRHVHERVKEKEITVRHRD